MVKIALDAGHGMNTAGKQTPDGEKEWLFNNKVVLATIDKLNTFQNVQILRLDDPTGKTDVPLRERTDKANAWGADALVSVHHNAHTGKWGSHGGVETYTQPGSQKASVDIAAILQSRIVNAMGLRDRGLKKLNLHMTRESKMPAILTEGGFMDSTTDIIAMRDDSRLKAQGVAIADGLAKYFKLTAGTTSKPVTVPKPPPTPAQNSSQNESKTISIVDYLNSLKIDSSPGNRRKLATAYGVKNYDLSAAKNIELLNKMRAGKPVEVKPKSKSISQMASEVIAKKHGNGHENRRKSLGISQAEYGKVRAEVNRRAGVSSAPKKTTQTVSQMANRIITDKKAPTGHEARRRWLGIDNATYQKVRAEVNRRL